MANQLHKTDMLERRIYHEVCRREGVKARELESCVPADKHRINQYLYGAPFLKELCYQDRDYRWHGLIRQSRPHKGLEHFCGYYGFVSDFLSLGREQWLEMLMAGCRSNGRNLNDTRGLLHSFQDCHEVMMNLFADLEGVWASDWELGFELRIKRARYIRIYADVLVITENKVFALEFKMKDVIEPEEVLQAAKYVEFLEVLFGPDYDVIPALVLTRARDLYTHVPIPGTEGTLAVCAGDMIFNLFDEYMGFLQK